jgi:hypothetical protein
MTCGLLLRILLQAGKSQARKQKKAGKSGLFCTSIKGYNSVTIGKNAGQAVKPYRAGTETGLACTMP